MKKVLNEVAETLIGCAAIAGLLWVLYLGACIAYVH